MANTFLLQRALAWLVAALIVVQAALGGRHLFRGDDIAPHAVIGNGVYAVGVVILVLAIVRRADRSGLVIAAVLLAALTAQIGLGYSTRESVEAAVWHIPLGVATFGVALALATRPDRLT